MKRILLCDDSGMVLTMMAKRMKDLGFEVVGKAKDGDEGIKSYLDLRPDLMLLDVTMPNKDGRECLQAIIESDKNATILFVSALQDQVVIDECLKLGAKGFINKNKFFDEAQFASEVAPLIKQMLKVV